MIRLCVDMALSESAALPVEADHARYLFGVMRQGVGDEILLFNGRDGEWRAEVSQVGKKSGVLICRAQVRPQVAGPDIELILALIKRAPLEWIVEKATELGVRRIRLVLTQRTNAERSNLERLGAIAREAAEQTGRLETPEILAPEKLSKLLEAWPADRTLIFCDEAGDDQSKPWGGEAGRAQPLLSALAAVGDGPASILIGPEGGFAPAERETLRALPPVLPATLGPRILRADTAAITALTLWQAVCGDWR